MAEVQVTNMEVGVTKRPYDTNLAMSVHSLLLVDALQTLGPDYEQLEASHKHVTVDSESGPMRGSHNPGLAHIYQSQLLSGHFCQPGLSTDPKAAISMQHATLAAGLGKVQEDAPT